MGVDARDSESSKEIIIARKKEGLRIPLKKDVGARTTTTLFEYVHLIHNALPELNLSEVDTSTRFLEHNLAAPLMIDSLTGGTPESSQTNAILAQAAENFGIAMAVGSQRAGLIGEELAETYSTARKNAPNAFIAANLGGAQLARGVGVDDAKKLIDMINADALVVHLNPIQEAVQPEGEPSFKGVLVKIRELVSSVKVPLIVKEVGAGISREVAIKLELAGVAAINISGAGGTSWAGVEHHRAAAKGQDDKAELGELFWDWGIPTAAALLEVRKAVKLPMISSGGIRNGLEMAKSLALGASMCAMAWPMLRQAALGKEALFRFIQHVLLELKTSMFLVGASNISAMKRSRYVFTGPLAEWAKSL